MFSQQAPKQGAKSTYQAGVAPTAWLCGVSTALPGTNTKLLTFGVSLLMNLDLKIM